MAAGASARGRRVAIKRDGDLTLEDFQQGKRDCALLMKVYGKSALLVSWLTDMKAGEERLSRFDDLDAEIDLILKGAA